MTNLVCLNKSKLKNIYVTISLKYPSIGVFIKRFYLYNRLFNRIHKKIKGSSNKLEYRKVILNNVTFDIKGNNNNIVIRPGSILNNVTFFIRGNSHEITIGENCIFSRGGSIWFTHHNGSLKIGKNTSMENVHIAVTEPKSQVVIGEDCMFAYDIDIRTGDSHSIVDEKSGKRINYAKDISIDNHVWLASHCRILKGVRIGKNSIVGTNTVVTKSFNEPGVILAGSPAKIVKRNISWDRKNIRND